MPVPLVESVVQVLEKIFVHDSGTPMFNIMVGVCLLTWVVVARLFMALFSSKRGVLSAFIGLLLPAFIGFVAYRLTEQYVVPQVDMDWSASVLPWVGFGVFLLLSIGVISSRIFALPGSSAFFIYVVATAGAVGAYFGTQITMGFIETGGGQVEQRERRQGDLDSIL